MNSSLRYAMVYLVLGSLWIILSDNLLFESSDSSHEIIKLSTGKGLLFVTLSSVLVFYLIFQARKRVDIEKKEIEKRESYLRQISTTTQREYCLVNNSSEVFFRNKVLIKTGTTPTPLNTLLSQLIQDQSTVNELHALYEKCLNSGLEVERDILENDQYFTFTFLPLDDELKEIILIIEDNTSNKREMKEQHLNREMLDLILNSEEIGLYNWNLVTQKTTSNSTLVKLIGAQSESEVPNNAEWISRVHPEDQKTSELAFQEHVEGNTEAYESQYRFKTLDGTYKWLIEYAKVIERNEQGEPLHMMGVVIDFDSFKKNEDRIVQQSALLKEMAHNNSHVVRGPLARILGLIDLMGHIQVEPSSLSPEQADILNKIKVSAEELDQVIRVSAAKLNQDN